MLRNAARFTPLRLARLTQFLPQKSTPLSTKRTCHWLWKASSSRSLGISKNRNIIRVIWTLQIQRESKSSLQPPHPPILLVEEGGERSKRAEMAETGRPQRRRRGRLARAPGYWLIMPRSSYFSIMSTSILEVKYAHQLMHAAMLHFKMIDEPFFAVFTYNLLQKCFKHV